MIQYLKSPALWLKALTPLAVICLLGFSQISMADREADLQKLQALKNEIEKLKSDLETTKSTRGELMDELETSEREAAELNRKVEELKREIEKSKNQLGQLEAEREDLTKKKPSSVS